MSHTVGAVPRADTGLVLQPFRGVRYDPSALDVGAVTCPPYDVIGPAEAARLAASEPHNLVHLTLAAATAPPERRYAGAAARWREWQASGVLRSDAAPALYVYEARHGGRRQLGLVGAVGLRAPADGVILPHEDVHPGPVADRLTQMQATDANLEPIFLVVPGFGAAGEVVAHATATAPLVDVATGTSEETRGTYRLWAITDPDALATVAAALRDRQALIADGHHRYTAYRQLQAARHAEGRGAGPWDFGLAFVVDADSYPPALRPIHRVVTGVPPAAVLAAVPPGADIVDLGEHLEPALAYASTFAAGPRDGTGHPVVVAGDGRYRLVTLPAAGPAGGPDRDTAGWPDGGPAGWPGGGPDGTAYGEADGRPGTGPAGGGPAGRPGGGPAGTAYDEADGRPGTGPAGGGPAGRPGSGPAGGGPGDPTTGAPGGTAHDETYRTADSEAAADGTAYRTADAGMGGTADGGHCAAWRELDVTALHRWLADTLRISDDQLHFAHSATEAGTLATQAGGTAFLLNPPSVAAVHAIAAAGDRMPRKSTSFGPKPLGGLVMRSLAVP